MGEGMKCENFDYVLIGIGPNKIGNKNFDDGVLDTYNIIRNSSIEFEIKRGDYKEQEQFFLYIKASYFVKEQDRYIYGDSLYYLKSPAINSDTTVSMIPYAILSELSYQVFSRIYSILDINQPKTEEGYYYPIPNINRIYEYIKFKYPNETQKE